MNEFAQNNDGYIVFEAGGLNPISYGASEKWFSTYDEAVKYALEIVNKRVEEYKAALDWNSVIVFEGSEKLMNESHKVPCGRVVFYWMNHNK